MCMLETSLKHVLHQVLFIHIINSPIRIFKDTIADSRNRRRIITILLQISHPFVYTRRTHCPELISGCIRIGLQIFHQRCLFWQIHGSCKGKVIIIIQLERSFSFRTFGSNQNYTTGSTGTINGS